MRLPPGAPNARPGSEGRRGGRRAAGEPAFEEPGTPRWVFFAYALAILWKVVYSPVALVVTSTVVPAVNSSFQTLNNEGAGAISGTFSGLPDGGTFTVKVGTTTMTFKITYKGGSGGNSVVITRIS